MLTSSILIIPYFYRKRYKSSSLSSGCASIFLGRSTEPISVDCGALCTFFALLAVVLMSSILVIPYFCRKHYNSSSLSPGCASIFLSRSTEPISVKFFVNKMEFFLGNQPDAKISDGALASKNFAFTPASSELATETLGRPHDCDTTDSGASC